MTNPPETVTGKENPSVCIWWTLQKIPVALCALLPGELAKIGRYIQFVYSQVDSAGQWCYTRPWYGMIPHYYNYMGQRR